ncbi:MAG: hypothetical protein WC775_05225 [Patescibacteria group bacterium]|jgi:hypothetical protein
MRKILAVALLSMLGIFVLVRSGSLQKFLAQKKQVPTVKGIQAATKKVVVKQSTNLVDQAKVTVQKTATSVVSTINNLLDQQTQQIISTVFSETTTTPPVVSSSSTIPTDPKSLVVVDFLTGKNKTFHFIRKQTYFFDMHNVPENFCLFINTSKYPIEPKKYLTVTFPGQGNYQMHFDYCSDDLKKFGDIIVE